MWSLHPPTTCLVNRCTFFYLQGRLPEDTPNWHLNKLKPWKTPDAMALGNKHKLDALSLSDPFKKVMAVVSPVTRTASSSVVHHNYNFHTNYNSQIMGLEEACKMFNKVLEINPDHQEARAALNCCVLEMNKNYASVKKTKHQIRVSCTS